MEVEAWLPRAAATRPEHTALRTPAGTGPTPGCTPPRAPGRRSWRRAAPGAASAWRSRCPPGLEFAQALHACLLLGAVAVPVDLRLSAAERAQIADGAVVCVEEPLAQGRRRRARSALRLPATTTHELDATAVVIHTSGTTAAPRPVELTYGNFLWSALGSAVALGLDPEERWLCALPLSHVGGLSILLRSAIYATTAVVHERFETDRVLDALQQGEATLVEPRRDDARAPARRRPAKPAGPALRADRRRPRAARAASNAPMPPPCR